LIVDIRLKYVDGRCAAIHLGRIDSPVSRRLS
jgi:hypothetical protein